MPVDRATFRELAGSFPSGVSVVTTVDDTGAPRGLTTQAFISLSTEPPLVLVSLDRSSRTLAALRACKRFAVNVLKAGSEDLSTRFATKAEDKFAGVRWAPSAVLSGVPILTDSVTAFMECTVVQVIEQGDHVMLVGSVEGGQVLGGTPLLYYRRTYAAWPEERPGPASL
ncbi:MAG TPA: flavin reductase family protein [Candidatus Limnocylindria bacterium]|nr:flavin reductase family protein [Candidatus Limnocylindria bacterium]